jgi:hypothetical protein
VASAYFLRFAYKEEDHMRSRLLFAFISVALLVAGCKTIDIASVPDAEVRLLDRVREYESYLSGTDKGKAWEMRSDDFHKRFAKADFIEYLKSDIHYSSDYRREYEIIYLDIRKNKAKVKMESSVQPIGGGEKEESVSYSYWIFERGGWYLDESGSVVRKIGWW